MEEKKSRKIFNLYLIYFICVLLFCVMRILSSYGVFMFLSNTMIDIIYSFIIQVGILGVIPMTLYCLINKTSIKSVFSLCHYEKPNFKVILYALGIGVLCFFINIIISSTFTSFLSFIGYKGSGGGGVENSMNLAQFLISILTTALLPAIFEEFVHRGLLLQGARHIGFKKSILISSLLFGLIHFNIEQFMFAFIIGLVIGFVVVVSKNIWTGVIIHFVNNFISTYLTFASANKLFLGDFFDKMNLLLSKLNFFLIILFVAIFTSIIISLLAFLIYKLYKEQIYNKVNKAIEKVYNTDKENNVNNNINKEKYEVYNMLGNNTVLNLLDTTNSNPINLVLPKQKEIYKPTFKDKIFLITTITLGSLVTLFTLIWGFF